MKMIDIGKTFDIHILTQNIMKNLLNEMLDFSSFHQAQDNWLNGMNESLV